VCGGVGGTPVDETEAPRIAHAERDVLGHRHPFDKAEVLVDERDGLRRTIATAPLRLWPTVEQHPPGVGFVDARQQLDQRALAGAVFAQQREHFASMRVERDVVDRLRAAEALADVLEPQQRRRVDHAVAPRVFSTMRYSDVLAQMYSSLPRSPPKHTLPTFSGTAMRPMRVPSGW
jgi:hypothetical protein